MALSVSNNNGGQPITEDGTYCTIQVPGYIPPQIAGPGGSSPAFESASYHIVTGSVGANAQLTFQAMTTDGTWRPMANPAPINLFNNQTYNSTLAGYFSALRLSFTKLTGAIAGRNPPIVYAQVAASPRGPLSSTSPVPALTLRSGDVSTELSIDPQGGDLIATALSGPNAGQSVNLTYGKWTQSRKSR